jgi:hypothetical protein
MAGRRSRGRPGTSGLFIFFLAWDPLHFQLRQDTLRDRNSHPWRGNLSWKRTVGTNGTGVQGDELIQLTRFTFGPKVPSLAPQELIPRSKLPGLELARGPKRLEPSDEKNLKTRERERLSVYWCAPESQNANFG